MTEQVLSCLDPADRWRLLTLLPRGAHYNLIPRTMQVILWLSNGIPTYSTVNQVLGEAL